MHHDIRFLGRRLTNRRYAAYLKAALTLWWEVNASTLKTLKWQGSPSSAQTVEGVENEKMDVDFDSPWWLDNIVLAISRCSPIAPVLNTRRVKSRRCIFFRMQGVRFDGGIYRPRLLLFQGMGHGRGSPGMCCAARTL